MKNQQKYWASDFLIQCVIHFINPYPVEFNVKNTVLVYFVFSINIYFAFSQVDPCFKRENPLSHFIQ